MIEEEIYKILEKFEGDAGGFMYQVDDTCPADEIQNMLDEKNIQYQMSTEQMFDSCGYDVWALSIAYIENDELKLVVEQLLMY